MGRNSMTRTHSLLCGCPSTTLLQLHKSQKRGAHCAINQPFWLPTTASARPLYPILSLTVASRLVLGHALGCNTQWMYKNDHKLWISLHISDFTLQSACCVRAVQELCRNCAGTVQELQHRQIATIKHNGETLSGGPNIVCLTRPLQYPSSTAQTVLKSNSAQSNVAH